MRLSKLFHILVLVLVATACTAQQTQSAGAVVQDRHLLMVSFDGFRNDYAERWSLPNFMRMAAEGSRAAALLPAYPSKTFPNHYSLVTGLYPGNHGIVDNSFHNRSTGTDYAISKREEVGDARHYGGTPLWQHLQAAGISTASYFWVGSEAPVGGSYPDHWQIYDSNVANEERITQVLDWLALPAAERPRFITLYFSDVDSAAHDTGPLSEASRAAALDADRLLGLIMDGLAALPHPVALVVVSDHGMYPVVHTEDSYIPLDTLQLPRSGVRLAMGQTQVQLYADDKAQVAALYAELKPLEAGFQVLRRTETPPHWHYGTHDNNGDLLLVADLGKTFVFSYEQEFKRVRAARGDSIGVHGYDARDTPELHAIFQAWGGGLPAGMKLPALETIDVFPFISRYFGVAVPDGIDGDGSVLQPLLGD
jgi:predicted AlkP superfamily pyrophosphatase or phosphodiesterase